ncbi:MAG: hypothetical protein KGS48_18430 [Bacteroidetes bacterium]|nr:hypothetical protein [Bacteroidota bacterium]
MNNQMQTLKQSMAGITEREDFSYALRNFLDRFYSEPCVEQLQDEPVLLTEILQDDGLADAYLASAAALLCQKHNLPQPAWVDRECRIKKIPWFAAKSPNLKAILLQESPAAFRVRNIFVSANALSRA